MATVAYLERRFIEEFVLSDRRDWYLSRLKGRKHRPEVLDLLNDGLEFDSSLAHQLNATDATPEGLLAILAGMGAEDHAHLMAYSSQHDGTDLRLERGLAELFDNGWGALLICPPRPVAVYRKRDAPPLLLVPN